MEMVSTIRKYLCINLACTARVCLFFLLGLRKRKVNTAHALRLYHDQMIRYETAMLRFVNPVSALWQLAEQDRHVTQSNVKIDTEVAGLKTMLESHKLDSIKYLAGNIGAFSFFLLVQ